MAKSFKKISDSAAAREQQSKIDALLSGTTNYPAEAFPLQSPTSPTSPYITYPPLQQPTPPLPSFPPPSSSSLSPPSSSPLPRSSSP